MMKKVIKKLLAALLAVAMVCAMVIPAFASGAATEDIKKHTFSAYQIFKGDISGSKLSNVTWGSNIGTDSVGFLTALSNDETIGSKFNSSMTIDEVLKVISNWPDSSPEARAFARAVSAYLMRDSQNLPNPSATSIVGTATIALPEAGYYLIVDTKKYTDSGNYYHTVNASLLKVSDQATVNIKPKLEKPTFDKEVWDNDNITNNAGFGSSADHAIGEPFKFKLTASLPSSSENIYDYYNQYAIAFTDIMSPGISFDNIDEVKINDTVINETDYQFTFHTDDNYFTLAIDDVKAYNEDLNNGATVTVLYTAHLNENAAVNTESGSTTNINKANLQYSNDPNVSSSVDTTPYKEVYVYTYQLNNTKYQDEIKDGNELAGAGFRLYSDEACNNEIKLKKNNDGTYSRDFSADAVGVPMRSSKDGQFNVKGLDAGTYYLRETDTPAGYNTCPDTRIVISATHTNSNVTLSNESNLTNDIVNKSGTTLPSTGGMGTTLFYVIGGGLMVAAVVLLVTKKRMENK